MGKVKKKQTLPPLLLPKPNADEVQMGNLIWWVYSYIESPAELDRQWKTPCNDRVCFKPKP